MKINSKFVQFDSNYRVEQNFSDAEFVRNSFYSILKLMIWLIRKGKKYSKNSMKINSKFVRFGSTPTIGWGQIFKMLDSFEIRLIQFENLWFDWFERWKIIRKIRWKSIRNLFDLIRLHLYFKTKGIDANFIKLGQNWEIYPLHTFWYLKKTFIFQENP